MKKAKKVVETKKRVRYYGLVKLRAGQKVTWESHENKHGWSLGCRIGKRIFWLRNVRFKTSMDAEVNLGAPILFVEKKHNKKAK